jgi:signal transduction histidine kinase
MSEKDTGQEIDTRQLIGSTPFSVSARVAMQLGRESISSSVTAIIELVKNAYDADAETVRIRFASLNSPHATMIIEDDGKGMSAEELQANWMVIGTSNKTRAQKPGGKGRVMTGEKGLGRLGLDRLCKRTRVQSMALGAAEAVELDVDWMKYEAAGQSRLEEVSHPLYRITDLQTDPVTNKPRVYPKGTCLILVDLKDKWDEAAIAELHSELSLLISPFHTQHDFRVEMDTDGLFSKFDGPVTPDSAVLSNANWKVIGTLDDNGLVDMRMTSRLHDLEFHPQPVLWHEFTKGEGLTPKCGALRFEFYFFARGERDTSAQKLSAPQLNQFLQNNQGIRIYRDGFRVKPYGEPNGEGDWLKLGFRRTTHPEGVKQKGTWKLGYNQVVGAVFLTREKNQLLIDQTNREGLVLGEAFRHLYIFAERVLTFFEKQRQKFERERKDIKTSSTDESEQAQQSAAEADAALKELSALAQKIDQLLSPDSKSAPPPTSAADIGQKFEDVSRTLAKSVKALEESVKHESERRIQTEREKDTLANLASLGILAACFGHETSGWAGTINTNAGWLHRNLTKHLIMVTPTVEEKVSNALEDIGVDSKKLQTFAAFALGNVRPDKRRQKTFCIKEVALEVFKAFADSLQHQKGIVTDLEKIPKEQCLIRGYLIDWESIFANLITNAMWAITKSNGERKIRFSIEDEPEHYKLTFEDSAFGLEAGTEEHVFDAGFSTRRNNKGEKEGTGMGLYIVKAFVEENTGGTIRAIANGDLGGASFIISVPKATKLTESNP